MAKEINLVLILLDINQGDLLSSLNRQGDLLEVIVMKRNGGTAFIHPENEEDIAQVLLPTGT